LQVLKLKLEGEKLTGTLTFTDSFGKDNVEKIHEGSFKDGVVSFTLIRKNSDTSWLHLKHTGKLEGDLMKGELIITDLKQLHRPPSKHSWEAKRLAE